MRWTLVCFIAACGASAQTAPEQPQHAPEHPQHAQETAQAGEDEYFAGLPQYPNARFLCTQITIADQGHVAWRGYATEDDLATVRAFYESRFHGRSAGESLFTFERDGEGFRVYDRDHHMLSAHPAGAGHPTCDVAHGPNDRTYLVLSTWH